MRMLKGHSFSEFARAVFSPHVANESRAKTFALHITKPAAKGNRRRVIAAAITIFLLATGVRLLHWQDNRPVFAHVLAGMIEEYKAGAHLLLKGETAAFYRGANPPNDADVITHPPGYPILTAAVLRIFGDSNTTARFFQIMMDAAAAVTIFLLALELLSLSEAIIAGTIVALSPQLAYYSLILLPDSPAILPVLLAIYFMARARKRPRLRLFMLSGALLGLSCWLRSNALLLAPFLVIVIVTLFERGRRLQFAAALLGATLLVIAPITIRNALVFHQFIPLSLGMGITLIEGIGDYDRDGRFGMPVTDLQATQMESRLHNRPDYVGLLFRPDGIARERERMARGRAVIRAHPFWFAGVMVRRAASMLRLSRVHIIAPEPAVTHSLTIKDEKSSPAHSLEATEWQADHNRALISSRPKTSSSESSLTGEALRVEGDDSAWGEQAVSVPITVQPDNDYLLRIPVKVRQGSVAISVRREDDGRVLASTPILHPLAEGAPEDQPETIIELPFVSREANAVRVVIGNGGAKRPVVELRRVDLYALGEATQLWTRYPRVLLRVVQRFFVTAWMLPLIIAGIALLARARHWRTLVLLLAVPVYYLCAQSALHTEYRYVLAIHYFLAVPAAVALYRAGEVLRQGVRTLTKRETRSDTHA
ncbi:MAG: ArnT family glycosyltransferase [Pyrinomonadaceae bacterium]